MANPKPDAPRGSNDWNNQRHGKPAHTRASDAQNAEMDRLKRNPQHVQQQMDRQK